MLDMRWYIANGVRSAIITVSYPTSTSGIIVLLIMPKRIAIQVSDFLLFTMMFRKFYQKDQKEHECGVLG